MRNKLLSENWHRKSKYFRFITRYLADNYQFNYMTTYLNHPEIPRAANSETVISVWRQMEAVRCGFKSNKGRQDHLNPTLRDRELSRQDNLLPQGYLLEVLAFVRGYVWIILGRFLIPTDLSI